MELDTIYHGDALKVLATFPSESIDSLVVDPPSSIKFMNQEWDANKGGRKQWVAWLEAILCEALRVLKPGAHGFVWALPRTSHWTMCAVEDSGFTIKDVVSHVFLQGMPKGIDISKAIDRQKGAVRLTLRTEDRRGEYDGHQRSSQAINTNWRQLEDRTDVRDNAIRTVTIPTTPEAQQWEGWNSQIKPCTEFWILVQKPIAEKTIVQQVLATGTGALNIDASRVGTAQRWPAQLLLSHAEGCVQTGTKTVRGNTPVGHKGKTTLNDYGDYNVRSQITHGTTEEVANWQCVEGCPVALLDGQSGTLTSGTSDGFEGPHTAAVYGTYAHNQINPATVYGDSGGASRVFTQFPYEKIPPFIYLPKASPSDRTMGKLVKNTHPCIKSTHLMKYLITLTTQPGGIVLDPFCGSGSTLVAAARGGFRFIGIEENLEFVEISRARLATLPKQQSQQPA